MGCVICSLALRGAQADPAAKFKNQHGNTFFLGADNFSRQSTVENVARAIKSILVVPTDETRTGTSGTSCRRPHPDPPLQSPLGGYNGTPGGTQLRSSFHRLSAWPTLLVATILCRSLYIYSYLSPSLQTAVTSIYGMRDRNRRNNLRIRRIDRRIVRVVKSPSPQQQRAQRASIGLWTINNARVCVCEGPRGI